MMSVLVGHAGRLMAVRSKLVLLAAAALFAGCSANCMEYKAWAAELAYLRADYEGNVPVAKDARERSKRLYALTAERRLLAFRRAMAAYDFDPSKEPLECPFLFSEQDEITFLLGLLTGMQAVVNDANSGARAATCVDNEKVGGLPNAVRALVWLLLPQRTSAPDHLTASQEVSVPLARPYLRRP